MKKYIRKLLEYIGLNHNAPEINRQLNRQNLMMSVPLLIINSISAVLRIIVLMQGGVESPVEWRSLSVYTLLLIVTLMMCGQAWMEYHNDIRDQKSSTVLIAAFSIVQMAYGLEVSMASYPLLGSLLPLYISAIWSFLLFNIRPWLSTAIALFFEYLLYIWRMRNGIPADTYQMHLFMFSLLAVSYIRYISARHLALNDSEFHILNHRLKTMSETDELTCLKNRHYLREHFTRFVGSEMMIAICDIDDFKTINDTYGHDVGDATIRLYAETLKEIFGTDVTYRFGGDEFLIFKENHEPDDLILLEKYKERISTLTVPDTDLKISTSIGYGIGRVECTEDVRQLLKIADVNLYKVKKNGKNSILGEHI